VEPALVASEFATVLGIVVTELVINACKYAYAPEEPGSIDVVLVIREGRFRLEVQDHGRGLNSSPATLSAPGGLGSRLIPVMTRRLKAEGRYLEREVGTAYVLIGSLQPVVP
jgi:two-component sensor histidine kinase